MKKMMIGMAALAILGFCQLQEAEASAENVIYPVLGDVTWEEIEQSDLPQAVLDTWTEDYGSYSFSKAYKGSDGTYKVKATMGGTEYYFVFDSSGNVKKEGKSEDKEKKMEY